MIRALSGVHQWVIVALFAAAACARQPIGRPAPTVDVLDFVLGDASMWPRTGTQTQDQRVDMDRREVCWVKYGRPRAFECWRWDDRFVYHEIDQAVDGRPGASYRFSDGRWLPRRLPLDRDWTMDLMRNTITTYDAACVASEPALFPYRVTAHLEAAQFVSPDLGRRAVLVLEYAPHAIGAPAAEPETFRFAYGAGWFAWSSIRGAARFDTVGGPRRRRTSFCGEETSRP
jgi:hypothetical protein